MHTTNQHKVGMAVKNDRLTIEPTAQPLYTLDELLAQCNASAEISTEDREWLDAHPIGGELS
ncbi:AbrB/MazE/SpoVT family DNA-binding domain-containing protein [Thauera sp. ZXT1-4]|uniref:hypothetical protein n=1 Tax=Thauera sp. ZXT1-4 TaxID=3460294 RepID=UPI0040415F35